FVPDPFGSAGARLYYTGDLARYLQDGNLEFFGRRDHQIKLRGYRIELGEIEALLNEHPCIHESVVVVQDKAGEKRLLAYVIGTGDRPGKGDLKAYLKQRLPEYMVPSEFITLTELPLTS